MTGPGVDQGTATVAAASQGGRLATNLPIERRGRISYAEFVRDYLKPRRPVVLTGLTEGWPAMERWTPEYFAQRWGDRKVELCAGRRVFRTTFRWFVNYLEKHSFPMSAQDARSLLYLRNVVVYRVFPELEEDFQVPDLFLPDWFELWPISRIFPLSGGAAPQLFIGPPGASLPMIHRDTLTTHAWLTQIYGSKRVWLVSPAEDHLVYQDEDELNHSCVNSLKDPDLEAFPLMKQATIFCDTLHPGETLFLPGGWWHSAECLSVSIGISGNFINTSNFSDFMSEFNRVPKSDRDAKHRRKDTGLRFAGTLFGVLFPSGSRSWAGGFYRYLRQRSLRARAKETPAV